MPRNDRNPFEVGDIVTLFRPENDARYRVTGLNRVSGRPSVYLSGQLGTRSEATERQHHMWATDAHLFEPARPLERAPESEDI